MAATIAITEASLHALSGFVPGQRHGRQRRRRRHHDQRDDARRQGLRAVRADRRRPTAARAAATAPPAIAVLLSNARTAPIEILESEFPTRVVRFELIRDSGGPGRYRGGLVAAPRVRDPHRRRAADVARRTARRAGLRCSTAAARTRSARCISTPGRRARRALPSRFSGVRLKHRRRRRAREGRRRRLRRSARRGRSRPSLDDVIDGYVSRGCGDRDYGVDAARLDAALAAWRGTPELVPWRQAPRTPVGDGPFRH